MILPREVLAHRSFTQLLDARPAAFSLSRHLAVRGRFRPDRHPQRETDTLTIAILGKCGHGKSSLLNAIVGEELFRTSHVGVGTRVAQSFEFAAPSFARKTLSILDLPGIGESEDLNAEHLALYSEVIGSASAFIYVIRADQRDLAIDEWVFSQIFNRRGRRRRTTVALTQTDKLHPINRAHPFALSAEQSSNLALKIKTVKHKFRVKSHQIVPTVAPEDFGVEELILTVARSLAPKTRR